MTEELIHNRLFLKTQRNKIFEVLKEAGLGPSGFQWREVESRMYKGVNVPMLVHTSSQFYCVLHTKDAEFFTLVYSPGANKRIENSSATGFEDMLIIIGRWVSYVRRETEAPDLWAAIYEEKKFAEAAASEPTNAPFSLEEQEYIATQLNEIKEFLSKTHDLTQEKMSFIEDRLSYLEDAAKRQGRRDWMHLALGVIFSIILQLALPGETARELLRFMSSIFSRIIGVVGFLPQ